ncbi:UNVERIFIED_CONTAM: hypothetical protein Sradi_7055000 [Sesamum radiatum]|uniref:Uncharacterized protein n=1 Tax=Sesamum radiatum TaxID=300843 RepID=A0AAW2J7V3_SESRA
MASVSSDESVRFVGENHPGEDPSEATSRMAASQSAGQSGGRRKRLCQMTATFRRLIDEEEEEVGGNEGEASSFGEEGRAARDLVAVHPSSSMDWRSSTLQTPHVTQIKRDFFIPSLQIIYTPGP